MIVISALPAVSLSGHLIYKSEDCSMDSIGKYVSS